MLCSKVSAPVCASCSQSCSCSSVLNDALGSSGNDLFDELEHMGKKVGKKLEEEKVDEKAHQHMHPLHEGEQQINAINKRLKHADAAEKLEAAAQKAKIMAEQQVQLVKDQVKMEEAQIGSKIEDLEKKIAKHDSLGKGSSPELEQMVQGEKAILSSLKGDEGKAAKDEKGANSLTWWQKLLRFLKGALGKAKQGINKIKDGLSSIDPSGAIMAKAQSGDESFKEVGLNGFNASDNSVRPIESRIINFEALEGVDEHCCISCNQILPIVYCAMQKPSLKHCGRVQHRYLLNIREAWYGNPKRTWSKRDGIDVTSILRKMVNSTTNELHLYPDNVIPMYYHNLFKVKIDQTGYEEEGLYKLALKYRYDDSVTNTKVPRKNVTLTLLPTIDLALILCTKRKKHSARHVLGKQ